MKKYLLFSFLTFFLSARSQELPSTAYVSEPTLTRTIDINKPVFSIPASLNVANGNASYTIPINSPAGINGLTPQVAISYNSAGGQGLLGWGWNLMATSEISMGGENYALDGVKAGMKFSKNDNPLTLDGIRLVLVDGIPYAVGSEYRTYQESYQKITFMDSGGILVESKDGTKKVYGKSSTHVLSVYANGVYTPYKWLLEEQEDRNGNKIQYFYLKNSNNNSYRINRIEYATVTGQSSKAAIDFYYTAKTDFREGYIDGVYFKAEELLSRIRTTYSNIEFSDYKFNYSYRVGANATDFSRLVEVRYEGLNNEEVNSTLIQWHTSASEFSFDPDINPDFKKRPESLDRQLIMDINGDGIDDVLSLEYSKVDLGTCYRGLTEYNMKRNEYILWANIKNASGSNFTRYKILGPIVSEHKPDGCEREGFCEIHAGDFNGDGLMDFILHRAEVHGGNDWQNRFPYDYYINDRSQPGTFNNSLTQTQIDHLFIGYVDEKTEDKSPDMYPFSLIPADYDGDGITDVAYMGAALPTNSDGVTYTIHLLVAYTNSDLTLQKELITKNGESWGRLDSTRVGDFNGDGKADLILLHNNGSKIIFSNTRSNWSQLYAGNFPNVHHYLQVGDFNGDGISDVIAQTSDVSSNFYIKIFDGSTFLPAEYLNASYTLSWIFWDRGVTRPSYFRNPPYPFVKDVDMDGRDDFIVVSVDDVIAYPYPQYYVNVHYNKITGWQHSSYTIPLQEIDSHTEYRDFYFADFNGSGRPSLFYYDYKAGMRWSMALTFRPFDKSLFVDQILDGFNRLTNFDYDYLTDPELYSRALNQYPNPSVIGGLLKVKGYTKTAFDGTLLEDQNFEYFSMRYNARGLGLLGFRKSFRTDDLTNITYEHSMGFADGPNYNTQDYPFVPLYSKSYVNGNSIMDWQWVQYDLLNSKTTHSNGSWVFSMPRIIEESKVDYLKGVSYQTNGYTYDSYDNVTGKTSKIYSNINFTAPAVQTKVAQVNYTPNGSWAPWAPLNTEITTTLSGQSPVSIKENLQYTNGNLVRKEIFPGTTKSILENYTYDGYGNMLSQEIVPYGMSPRLTSFTYTTDMRFKATEVSPMGWTNTYAYDLLRESVTSETDYNDLVTSYTYDNLGRLTKTIVPDGNEFNQDLIWDVGQTFTDALYYLSNSSTNGAPSKTFYSGSLQELVGMTKDRKDEWVFSKKVYNSKHQLWKSSLPYKSGSSPIYSESTYDDYGRLIQQSLPSGVVLQTSFSDLTVSQVNLATGQSSVKAYDAIGNLVSSSDDGGTVTYTYNSWGKPILINSPSGTQTMDYDETGLQTQLNDPAAGIMQYEYDPLGQLIRQEDANGNVFDISYDLIGREISRSGPDGLYAFQYDNTFLGLLYSASSPYGTSESYSYDGLGRLLSHIEVVDGTQYEMRYAYDQNSGYLKQLTYPGNLEVSKEYDQNGYVERIRRMDNNDILWEFEEQNDIGQITTYNLGNVEVVREYDAITGSPVNHSTNTGFHFSYQFNSTNSNLDERQDIGKGLAETFDYDDLDRLITQQASTGGSSVELQYENNGNITWKSDVGSYENTNTGQTSLIAEAVNISPAEQSISYTPFNSVESIMEGDFEAFFTYGVDDQRRKMRIMNQGNEYIERVYLFGGAFEQSFHDDEWYNYAYVNTPSGTEAVLIGNGYELNETNYSTYFLNRDYLGSILSIMDVEGVVLEEYGFDAWGNRRDAQDWQNNYLPGEQFANFSGLMFRGFTGHEHLDCFGLINMNGRLYDPLLGRMLSPDNFVQSVGYSQNYNRYAYVFNNPLSYTDPSGEIVWAPIIIGAVFGAYSGGSLANGSGNLSDWKLESGKTWGYMLGGALVGGLSGHMGYAVSVSGMPFANTASIAIGSFVNSLGMNIVSRSETDVSIGFGVGSINLNNGELNYFGKGGNSRLENVGYGLGAMANLSDVLIGFKPGSVQLRTENDPNYEKMNAQGVFESAKDIIGHSQIVDFKGNTLVDWGPTVGVGPNDWVPGTNNYERGPIPKSKMKWGPVKISGVNVERLTNWNPTGNYNLIFNSCVSQTSRALNAAGVFNIGIHPYLLHGQMYLRSLGIRPYLFSYHAY